MAHPHSVCYPGLLVLVVVVAGGRPSPQAVVAGELDHLRNRKKHTLLFYYFCRKSRLLTASLGIGFFASRCSCVGMWPSLRLITLKYLKKQNLKKSELFWQM